MDLLYVTLYSSIFQKKKKTDRHALEVRNDNPLPKVFQYDFHDTAAFGENLLHVTTFEPSAEMERHYLYCETALMLTSNYYRTVNSR